MGRKKREKKPLSKGRRFLRRILRIIGAVILFIILLVAVLFGPFLYRYLFTQYSTKINTVETSLTAEQRLSDFDYMYEVVCREHPNRGLYEQAYGISYDDEYNRYRELILNCDTDFEYLSYLTCFLRILPGQHNYMTIPNYTKTAVNGMFSLTDIYGSQDVRDYAYSWQADFRDDVEGYLDYNITGFKYVDGVYIGVDLSAAVSNSTDYPYAQLISLDGKDPADMCFEFMSTRVPCYDSGNDRFYRPTLYFNDGIGIRHEAELLMPDGETITVDLYEDPAFNLAISEGASSYPDLFGRDAGGTSEDVQEEVITDIWDDNFVPSTYRIYTDAGRHLVYLDSLTCDTTEGERLVRDLTDALNEVDAQTVILDVRSNGGGSSDFVTDQLLPVLFSHDLEFRYDVVGDKNDNTRHFYNVPFYYFYNLLVFGSPVRTDADNFYVHEDMSVEGHAAEDYTIYVLTSQDTFSSGDIIARLCQIYDNATVIGTNTGGEGICGSPFNCYLPESRFMFNYTPTMNVEYPEDDVYGTEPDIYIPYTLDEYMQRASLRDAGADYVSYESRLEWDQTLITAVEMADNS